MKILSSVFLLFTSAIFAQQSGIIPFSGASYYSSGISFKEFEIELDNKTWTSNRLPINKQFSIKLVDPVGFYQEGENVFPTIEVCILNPKGDTLGYSANIFGEEMETLDVNMLKKLTLMLTFNEMSKVGDTVLILGRFYDKKSPNFVRINFPMVIVAEDLPLQNTNSVYGSSSYKGYNAKAAGAEISVIETYRDSTFMPKELFHSIRVAEIAGISKEEVEAGSLKVYLYDQNMKEFPLISKPLFFVVNSTQFENKVNILAKIPLLSDDPDNVKFTARLRWESADGQKVIDVVSKIDH